ncbi:MAG: hypothetical protein IT449_11870 [Phycisphaerales bacterium]|nr:hypothetical protein [Phycisphaerales bacterium]
MRARSGKPVAFSTHLGPAGGPIKDPIALLSGAGETLALRVAASALFTTFRRTFQLPPDVMALVTRVGDDHETVRPGGQVDGRDAVEVLFVRAAPLPLTLRAGRFVSADAYPAEVEISLSARAIPDRGDLLSLKRRLGEAAQSISCAQLAEAFLPGVRAAIEPVFTKASMTQVMTTDVCIEMEKAIGAALESVAFSCGLSIDAGIRVRAASETYERVRRAAEDAEQSRRQVEAAAPLRAAQQDARRQQVQHFSELLAEMRAATGAENAPPLRDFLRTFAEHERAQLYESLFAEKARTAATRAILVAAGPELLVFDPPAAPLPSQRFSLAGGAGAPRSVHIPPSGGNELRAWIGASSGVYEVRLTDGVIEASYGLKSSPSVRGGFNSVAVSDTAIYASHSELGIRRWRRDEPDAADAVMLAAVTQGAQAIRAIQLVVGSLYCAVDDRVIRWSSEAASVSRDSVSPVREYLGAGAQITALLAERDEVLAGTADGRVLHWRVDSPHEPRLLHTGRGRPVESLAVIEHEGVRRLFIADTSVCVHARLLDDATRWSYEAGGQTLRRAAVAADLIVAVTDLRDRLVLFDPGVPDRPQAVHHIAQLTGHSVQDVALVAQQGRPSMR